MSAPVQHILLGCHGDLIQMLPVWRELHARTGHKPQVIVSRHYASTLDGASYIDPLPLPVHWYREMPGVIARYPDAVPLQVWLDPNAPEFSDRAGLPLTINGRKLHVDTRRDPHYAASMMRRAGFSWDEAMRLPLVFDRRDSHREAELLGHLWRPYHPNRRLLLYNFTGVSSPFGHTPALWPLLQHHARDFKLVDLGKVRAHRLYDLLGLYDVAVGLLTCDTATAHLAPASRVPTIWFTQDGWLGSVPRGNCVLHIPYSQTPRRLTEVATLLQGWARATPRTTPVLVSQGQFAP